jgi:hypothetical protein
MGTVFCGNDACFGPQATAERLEDSAVQWNTRASSPAQEPVTTEPVAWTNEARLGFLKESAYRVVPMAMWAFHHSAHPIALYAIPAPPQPEREEIAKVVYDLDPFEEGGEYVDGFIVSPGGKLSWEQAKARDAEFADDKIMLSITKFAWDAADAIRALIGEPK